MASKRRKEKDVDNNNKSGTRDSQNKSKHVLKRKMKATSKKQQKAQSEVSQRRLRSHRPPSPGRKRRTRKHPYNLRSGSSVILVCEVPCCATEEQRRKLARLKLDSALFCSRSPPAKRKQSHVSVITISSSDDCTVMDRTAEWVANMDIEAPGNLDEEENIVVEDCCKSKTTQAASAEAIRTKMSMLHLPTSSRSTIELSSRSKPETTQNSESQQCEITQTEVENTHQIAPRSFLTNPSILFNEMDTHESNNDPFSSHQQSEGRDMSDSTLGNGQRFYFGRPQGMHVTRDAGTPTAGGFQFGSNGQNSQLPSFGTLVFTGMSSQVQSGSVNSESERQREEEARQRSLLQVPSTSQSPVFHPVLRTVASNSSNSDTSFQL